MGGYLSLVLKTGTKDLLFHADWRCIQYPAAVLSWGRTLWDCGEYGTSVQRRSNVGIWAKGQPHRTLSLSNLPSSFAQ